MEKQKVRRKESIMIKRDARSKEKSLQLFQSSAEVSLCGDEIRSGYDQAGIRGVFFQSGETSEEKKNSCTTLPFIPEDVIESKTAIIDTASSFSGVHTPGKRKSTRVRHAQRCLRNASQSPPLLLSAECHFLSTHSGQVKTSETNRGEHLFHHDHWKGPPLCNLAPSEHRTRKPTKPAEACSMSKKIPKAFCTFFSQNPERSACPNTQGREQDLP